MNHDLQHKSHRSPEARTRQSHGTRRSAIDYRPAFEFLEPQQRLFRASGPTEGEPMTKPNPTPEVADEVPWSDGITEYDNRHDETHIRQPLVALCGTCCRRPDFV